MELVDPFKDSIIYNFTHYEGWHIRIRDYFGIHKIKNNTGERRFLKTCSSNILDLEFL